MRLLKRRKVASFDPAMGDPELQQAIDRLIDGDWRYVHELIDQREDSWVIGTVLHDPAAEIPIRRFEEWAETSGKAIAMAHLGHAQLSAAWVARGKGYADEVTEAGRQGFFDGLQQAEATFQQSAEMDEYLAEPWVGLMATALGLELRKREIENRFVQAHSREPFRPDACHHMLQSLTAKWSGTHDEMFEFVEWIRHEAPNDAPCVGIVPMAHLEYLISGVEKVPLSEYLQRSEVAEEIIATARPLLEATSAGAGVEYVPTLNLFMLMVEPTDALSGRILRETIRRVADRPSALPWRYFGHDIDARFIQVRDERAKAAKRL